MTPPPPVTPPPPTPPPVTPPPPVVPPPTFAPLPTGTPVFGITTPNDASTTPESLVDVTSDAGPRMALVETPAAPLVEQTPVIKPPVRKPKPYRN